MGGESGSPGADAATGGGVTHMRMRRWPGPPLLPLVPRRHVGEHAEHGVADLVSLQQGELSQDTIQLMSHARSNKSKN